VLFDGEVSGDESYGYEITATIADDFGAGIFKVSAPFEAPFGHLNLLGDIQGLLISVDTKYDLGSGQNFESYYNYKFSGKAVGTQENCGSLRQKS
jgi:hypothetical protein